jgi:hypothetical protein
MIFLLVLWISSMLITAHIQKHQKTYSVIIPCFNAKKAASNADSLSIRSNENQCSSSLLTQAVSLDKI